MKRVSLDMVLLGLALACVAGCAAGQIAINAKAYWGNYDAEKNNWNMTSPTNVFCSTWYADESLAWRSAYNWTAYCAPAHVEPQGEQACGKCLHVTNLASGAQAQVRVVDSCGDAGLVLDKVVFDALDTDGSGAQLGHLLVEYDFFACDDPKLIRLPSQ